MKFEEQLLNPSFTAVLSSIFLFYTVYHQQPVLPFGLDVDHFSGS